MSNWVAITNPDHILRHDIDQCRDRHYRQWRYIKLGGIRIADFAPPEDEAEFRCRLEDAVDGGAK